MSLSLQHFVINILGVLVSNILFPADCESIKYHCFQKIQKRKSIREKNDVLITPAHFVTQTLHIRCFFFFSKTYYYDRCVKDMCRNSEDMDTTPVCTWTSDVAKFCADFHFFLDWSFNNATTACSTF